MFQSGDPTGGHQFDEEEEDDVIIYDEDDVNEEVDEEVINEEDEVPDEYELWSGARRRRMRFIHW